MLQVARKHAGTDGELIDEIDELLAGLETELPPETMAASRRRAEARQLEDVVQDLLTRGLPGLSRVG